MCKAISDSHVPYTGPAYHAMRTTLLDEVKKRVETSCGLWQEHGLRVTGFVLVSDWWADAENRLLLNFMLVTPKGYKFLRTVDTSGQTKPEEYVANQLADIIFEIGLEHISAVIMDGASDKVNARRHIEDR